MTQTFSDKLTEAMETMEHYRDIYAQLAKDSSNRDNTTYYRAMSRNCDKAASTIIEIKAHMG